MPAWNALYQIRDFGARVTDFRASDAAGNSLPVRRLDKGTWQIDTYSRGSAVSGLRIQYAIFWDDPGPFDTQLNDDHAFINLAMILCYVPERRGEDDIVRFTDLPHDWRIAVELSPDKSAAGGAAPSNPRARCHFDAPNYDALVDAPVEIGRFDEWTFTGGGAAAGRTIRVVYHGETRRSRRAHAHALANRELRNRPDGRRAVSRVHLFPARGPELRRRRNGARQLHGDFGG